MFLSWCIVRGLSPGSQFYSVRLYGFAIQIVCSSLFDVTNRDNTYGKRIRVLFFVVVRFQDSLHVSYAETISMQCLWTSIYGTRFFNHPIKRPCCCICTHCVRPRFPSPHLRNGFLVILKSSSLKEIKASPLFLSLFVSAIYCSVERCYRVPENSTVSGKTNKISNPEAAHPYYLADILPGVASGTTINLLITGGGSRRV